jgi:hypothetical protein
VIKLRTAARRRDLFDESVAGRLLENSDTVIGVPHLLVGRIIVSQRLFLS